MKPVLAFGIGLIAGILAAVSVIGYEFARLASSRGEPLPNVDFDTGEAGW